MTTRLMHRLPLKASFALSLPLLAAILSAFSTMPAHAGVWGRRAGSAKAFEYSPALARSRIVWNQASLRAWLIDPEKLIPGQRMGYRLPKPQERADVVAYLATLPAGKPSSSQ
jgi:cytochrome c2